MLMLVLATDCVAEVQRGNACDDVHVYYMAHHLMARHLMARQLMVLYV